MKASELMCRKTVVTLIMTTVWLVPSVNVQSQEDLDVLGAAENRFYDIYEKINPSVVGIRVEIPNKTWVSILQHRMRAKKGLPGESSPGTGSSPETMVDRLLRNFPGSELVPEDLLSSPIERYGTGIVYDTIGDILTTYQVVKDVTGDVKIVVITSDETELPAEVGAVDSYTNLAVLRCPSIKAPPVSFPAEKILPKPGSFVFCVSRPYGLPNSAYFGIVCGTNRQVGEVRYERLIQTTVPLHPGSHGSPIVLMDGTVVGVLSSTLKHEGWEQVSFAIPAFQIRDITDKLIKEGTIVRGYLGVRVANPSQLKRLNASGLEDLFDGSGAAVTYVMPNSPAAEAGIRPRDLIVKIGNEPIRGWEDLVWAMHGFGPNTDVPITLRRGKEDISATVHVGNLPATVD